MTQHERIPIVRIVRRGRAKLVIAAAALLALSACGSGSGANSSDADAAGQPDVNGDGDVVIGILSPGDIKDGGYFQSFVDNAEAVADEKGWEVIARGNVAPADALSAARALCQQNVDMVALGASSLSDAIPASEEAACQDSVWYVPAQENVEQSPRIMLSEDNVNEGLIAAGYAAGLKMEDENLSTAGFVGGLDVEFEQRASAAFKAGVKLVNPDAKVLISFAGDQNDSAKAKEATKAQLSQGAEVIYPYLGGSTDAAAKLANSADAITLTPGTDRCDTTDPAFDISVIFDPGAYFRAALEQFDEGGFEIGTSKMWKMGKDPVPTVKYCDSSSDLEDKLEEFMSDIGSGDVDPDEEVKSLGS